MAVKLRLKRMGSKKKPFYRIVAADSRSPRDGTQPTDTVRDLLKKQGILAKRHNSKKESK